MLTAITVDVNIPKNRDSVNPRTVPIRSESFKSNIRMNALISAFMFTHLLKLVLRNSQESCFQIRVLSLF